MKRKIIFLLLLSLVTAGNFSCGDKFSENIRDKHIIPYVAVHTQIKLNVGGEDNNWANNPKYFTTSIPEGKSLGYKGHGIIIFTSDNIEYKCYDATCTNCTDLESHFTQRDLNVDIAVCPVCGTKFSLALGYAFGNTEKIYPLKNYPIVKTANTLIVNY